MKQVIVVNAGLRLPVGKLAAQVAHAAVAAWLAAPAPAQHAWLAEGMPKVVLKVATEADLVALHRAAQAAGLPAALIWDAGRTVVPAGTLTCLGLGPAGVEQIDALTAALRLL